MMEVCAGIGLVGAIVGRESDISVDAKHGTANRPWVRNIGATDAAQSWSEISDKLQHRVAHGRLVSRSVREKPLPIVVEPQVAKESEQRWPEISSSRLMLFS
jgi:hypothetical protein